MNEIDAMRIEELNVNKMDMEEMKKQIQKHQEEQKYLSTLIEDMKLEIIGLEQFGEQMI